MVKCTERQTHAGDTKEPARQVRHPVYREFQHPNPTKLLEQAKQNMHNLEEQQRQNERDLKELQHYQKEIDTYLGKKHEDI